MNIAQHYTRKKTQPIIWGREDMQTAKDSMIVDLGWMEKVGRITTSAAAGAWEEGEIKRYMQQHGGERPKYNLNDSGK